MKISISLEKDFMNYQIDDILYGTMIVLSEDGLLPKKKYGLNRQLLYNNCNLNAQDLKRHLNKLIEYNLIEEKETYFVINKPKGRYQLIDIEILKILIVLKQKRSFQTYVWLLNKYQWKSFFIFSNKDILSSIGYSTDNRTKDISNILHTLKSNKLIDYQDFYKSIIDESGKTLPCPQKKLLWVKNPSIGENVVSSLLTEAGINFEIEKIFLDFPHFRFDFYVENKYIIEYDGEQHFQPVSIFGGEKQFLKTKASDKAKNDYCFNNNIPIIRIPYHALGDLQIKDLIPELSNYKLT